MLLAFSTVTMYSDSLYRQYLHHFTTIYYIVILVILKSTIKLSLGQVVHGYKVFTIRTVLYNLCIHLFISTKVDNQTFSWPSVPWSFCYLTSGIWSLFVKWNTLYSSFNLSQRYTHIDSQCDFNIHNVCTVSNTSSFQFHKVVQSQIFNHINLKNLHCHLINHLNFTKLHSHRHFIQFQLHKACILHSHFIIPASKTCTLLLI